ncbi:MAG: hypothetical protein HQ594_00540 [Candidatus Omnitrophica bacterium]|nr:hypothetical protein [Candidatus Omnitrophota bacterium]
MFTKIFGTFWIIIGLFWLVRPEALKNRLRRKMTWKMRWLVFGLVIAVGFLLMGSAMKLHGLFARMIGIIGIILVIRAIIGITSKTSEKVLEWWGERPVYVFRIWALIVFGTGLVLVFGK